jgi:hypothetical protein|tara:strand:- start:11 stop:277 length:267 start_codon:yes stop_codon:yes gene_type:complete
LKSTDHQVAGDHYKKLKIQPIEYILANDMGFCEGAIVKYISRWKNKGGVEDLRKIKQFCDFLIEDAVTEPPLPVEREEFTSAVNSPFA